MILGKFHITRNKGQEEKYAKEKASKIIEDRIKELQVILGNSNNMTDEAKTRL